MAGGDGHTFRNSAGKARWVFGQHQLGFTLLGLLLVAVAMMGLAMGWLGPWGYVVWPIVAAYGFVGHVCLTGHFLLFAAIRYLVGKKADKD